MKMKILGLLALALVSVVSAARADTIISNMPVNGGGNAGVTTTGLNAAMGFSMPSGPAYALTSVTLFLSSVEAGDVPLIRLFSDSGSNPSSELLSLVNPAFPSSGAAAYTFLAPSPFSLLGNTSYWIVADAAAGSFSWLRNNPVTFPTGIATFLGTRFNGNPPTNNADTFAYGITIEGYRVPEPGTLALLGLGLTGLALSRKRKAT